MMAKLRPASLSSQMQPADALISLAVVDGQLVPGTRRTVRGIDSPSMVIDLRFPAHRLIEAPHCFCTC
jgi:hypothetical protein